jgi:hypothetical protein
MQTRKLLLRGAIALALAVAVAGSSALVPSAQAMSLADQSHAPTQVNKKKENTDAEDTDDGGLDLGSVPFIGEIVGGVKGNSPADTARNAIDLVGGAVDLVVPMIGGLGK